MAQMAVLRECGAAGTIKTVDDPEATQLMLEALFEIRGKVGEIHAAIFGGGDDEEESGADS
jgi:hypothetical protein